MEKCRVVQYIGTTDQHDVLEALNIIIPGTIDEKGSVVVLTSEGFQECELEDYIIVTPDNQVFVGKYLTKLGYA